MATKKTKKSIKQKPGRKHVGKKPPVSKHPPSRRRQPPMESDGRLKLLTAFGKTMPRIAWARTLGIKGKTLDQRLKNHPAEIALSPDFRKIVFTALKARGFWHNKRKPRSEKTLESFRRNSRKGAAAAAAKAKRYTMNGETHSVTEWAAILGVKRHTLAVRLQTHTPEVALTGGDLKHLAGIPRDRQPGGRARR